jgi:hypothetical protein
MLRLAVKGSLAGSDENVKLLLRAKGCAGLEVSDGSCDISAWSSCSVGSASPCSGSFASASASASSIPRSSDPVVVRHGGVILV